MIKRILLVGALAGLATPAVAQQWFPGGVGIPIVCAYSSSPPTIPSGGFVYAQCSSSGTLLGGGGGGGGGTSSNFSAAFPSAGTAAGFEYLSSPPTLTSGQMVAGQTDINGNLKVNVVSGGGSNASVGSTGSSAPTSATYMGILSGGNLVGWSGAVTQSGAWTVTQSGTWNLNNITGTVSLPTGASTSANQSTEIASLATIASAVQAAIPAGTATIGNVNGAPNITATDCSGTITTGGTAQNAFTAQTSLHGFVIKNIDATSGSGEPLWISFTGTATANTAASYPLAAPTATTFASGESFTAPTGFGLNHALSVIAATTGHKFSCTWW